VGRADLAEAHPRRGTIGAHLRVRTNVDEERAVLEILLVDDEPSILEIVGNALRAHGHNVALAPDGAAALEAASNHPFDAMVCDVRMPEVDGLAVLKRMRSRSPETAVILMTAHGAINEAVRALHYGAFDYLTKPFTIPELLARLQRVRPAGGPRLPPSPSPVTRSPAAGDLLGRSPQMARLREMIARFANAKAPVLITGESGTGKELVARALHAQSDRRYQPFVALNCASLPETLLEAELFGHERGAFTGAVSRRDGRFRAADGGTLLLDEVAELPLQSQPKLLRVLQQQSFEPLGTNQTVQVDVRVLSATHRSLKELLAEGRFREDLYYRLKILELDVPPLRERLEDLPLLISHFIEQFGTADSPGRVSPEANRLLNSYPYPGNVRELEHAIRHAMVLAVGEPELRVDHLPPDIAGAVEVKAEPAQLLKLHDAMAQYERAYLQRALELGRGQRMATALLLGISRKNLWEKLRRHGITGETDVAESDPELPELPAAPRKPTLQ
jgi:DNA-binding NtrC family response regulator